MAKENLRRIGFAMSFVSLTALTGCANVWNCCCHPWHTWQAHCHHRSLAIPDTYPVGSVNRAHYHTMETNGEAADFVIHRNEFVRNTAELTPYGKDHIVEIAARMPSTPFPVVIERTENNSDPERDEHRRMIVARVLSDFGVPEADQRTLVAPAYGRGINSREGEIDYFQVLYGGRNGNAGGFGAGGAGAGGAGGIGGGIGGGGFGAAY
jgi:hypothetical protein